MLATKYPTTSPQSSTTERFSLFGNLVDNGTGLRELESETWTEQWLESLEAGIFLVNEYFDQVEAEFIEIRTTAQRDPSPSPGDFYDQIMLRIHRYRAANLLLRRCRPHYRQYVQRRAKMPFMLPPLPKRPLSELEKKVEARLKEKERDLVVA